MLYSLYSLGLIPARAGKTASAALIVPEGTAHPRAGGENLDADLEAVSPQWLIPARAGKTPRPRPIAWRAQAHPRAGGENTLRDAHSKGIKGSSPRGRGKPSPPTTCNA